MTSGPERTSPTAPDRQEYVLRRAPRLSAVVVLSAILGVVLGLIGTALVHSGPVPPTDPYSGAPLSFSATLGYMAPAGALACVVLGLLVWLLLDRRSRRTQRTVVLERTDDPALADVSLDRSETAALRARPAADPSSGRTPEQ